MPLSAGRYNTAVTRDHTRAAHRRAGGPGGGAGVDPARYAATWQLQLGTLGSGNHFIEMSASTRTTGCGCSCTPGRAASATRSPSTTSRSPSSCARQWWITLPDPDLAYLVEGTDEFWAYMRDLRWAQHFALLNREEMMDRVVDLRADWVGRVDRAGRI